MLQDCAADTVLVHDASMPFASRSLCGAVLAAAARDGAAGAFLEPVLPAGYASDGRVVSRWSREHVRLFQSPQGFSGSCLALLKASSAEGDYESIADRVIKAGVAMTEVPGHAENIKITTPLDWSIAQTVLDRCWA
jgi:2-C-methyl-D-erythritol 4-phosphate cytidylyltransferase